jgi:hypothetical protein
MALYSLVVSCHGIGSFAAQAADSDALAAALEFLRGGELAQFIADRKGWPANFSERDIYSFIPVPGATNVYQCELGRDGRYVSIAISRTVSRQERRPLLHDLPRPSASALRRRT